MASRRSGSTTRFTSTPPQQTQQITVARSVSQQRSTIPISLSSSRRSGSSTSSRTSSRRSGSSRSTRFTSRPRPTRTPTPTRPTTPRTTTQPTRTRRPTRTPSRTSSPVREAFRDDFTRSLTPEPVIQRQVTQIDRVTPSFQGVGGRGGRSVGSVRTGGKEDFAVIQREVTPRGFSVVTADVQQRSLEELGVGREPREDLGRFTGFSSEKIVGRPTTDAEVRAQTDPRFFLSVKQQRDAGVGVKPRFSGGFRGTVESELDKFGAGLERFDRGELDERIGQAGIDPRSPVGEAIGGFGEFSIGFSEEIVGQASSLVNLENLVRDDITRKGRVDLAIIGRADIGFDVGKPELVRERREVTIPRTISSEFIGGGIEGLLTGQDAGALAQQRASDFLVTRKGQDVRTAGQVSGFLLPLVVGGAGILQATVKAPRAFLPTLTSKTVKATPALRKTQQQLAFRINKIRLRQETLQDKNVQQVLKIQGIKFKNQIPTKSLSAKEIKRIERLDEAFRIKNNKLTAQVRQLNRRIPKSVGADEVSVVTESTEQVARGLTFFGRPIVSKLSGQGRLGGFRRGAPSSDDLLPQIRNIGSTQRTAPSFAEGSTRFQQGINESVVNRLVQRGDLSKEFGEFFVEASRAIRTANRSPVNVLRGFGKQPIKKLTVAENKAVIDYFSKGGGKGLQLKGSFSARTQIRKQGLRDIGDIDADLSKFGTESVELSALKARELAGLLSRASGRKFTQGTGKRVGKIDLKKGKSKDKVVEFLNTLDEEEAVSGLNRQDIVFGVKGTKKSVNVEGINLTRLTQEFKRKSASIFSLQRSGTAGVPDDAGRAVRFGAPKGRFEKDAIDLFHEGKTIVATLRGLNRRDKLLQSFKLKGVSTKQIDRLEDFVDNIPKRFPKNAKGKKINYNNPSASTKQLISFTKSNPLKSIASRSIKAGSKSSKSLRSSGLFARSLNSALASKSSRSSKTSRASSVGSVSPSIFSIPSGSVPRGSPSSSIFDPFSRPTTSRPTGSKPTGSKPSGSGSSSTGSTPTGSTPTTPTGSGISGGFPSTILPFGQPLGRGSQPFRRRGRSSRVGRRLFDIADQPFGEISVGLGFFVEARRGETSVEQVLKGRGLVDDSDDFIPITRQEKQARARLGRQSQSDNGIDLDSFFS